jgi:hypothetical protein
VLTIAVANYFANREEIGFSGDRYPEKLPPEVWDELGFPKALLEELEEPVSQEIEKAKVFLKMGGV